MKDPMKQVARQKQKVLDKISENDGEIVRNEASLIKAIFPENRVEQAVRTYFESSESLNQKTELSGGTRLTVFLS